MSEHTVRSGRGRHAQATPSPDAGAQAPGGGRAAGARRLDGAPGAVLRLPPGLRRRRGAGGGQAVHQRHAAADRERRARAPAGAPRRRRPAAPAPTPGRRGSPPQARRAARDAPGRAPRGRAAGWTSPARSTPPGSGATNPGRATTSARSWPAPSTPTIASWGCWRRSACRTASASRTPRTGAWPARCAPSAGPATPRCWCPPSATTPSTSSSGGRARTSTPCWPGGTSGRSQTVRERVPCDNVIVDQFADARYITLPPAEGGRPGRGSLNIVQLPRAEANLAVAAASVLARDRFLGWLEQTGREPGPAPAQRAPPPRWRRSPGRWWRRTARERPGPGGQAALQDHRARLSLKAEASGAGDLRVGRRGRGARRATTLRGRPQLAGGRRPLAGRLRAGPRGPHAAGSSGVTRLPPGRASVLSRLTVPKVTC